MDAEFKTDANLVVLKGKFKATGTSSFGLFIIFMDSVTKQVDRFDIVSSHFSTVFENNINMPWSEMEDLISQMKWKGEYATNLTHDIQSSLEDLFEPGTGRTIDIWHALKRSQTSKAVAIIEEYMVRPTGDKNIKVELGVESINRSDIEKVKQMREMRENQDLMNAGATIPSDDAANPKIEDSAVVLDVSLVLSPISGVSLMELNQGDKILIKISEQSNRGQYFIDLFNAQQDGNILPVPATLESVTQDGKFYTAIVQLGPGVYGKALSEDNVKCKKYNPAQDKRKIAMDPSQPKLDVSTVMPQENSSGGLFGGGDDEETKRKRNNIIFIIIGALAFLLLLILVILFV